MSLLGTAVLTLGTTVAKYIVKSWIDDGSLLEELAPDLVDLVKEGGLQRWTSFRNLPPIERAGQQVAHQLLPLFEHEAAKLDKSTRNAILIEAARTLVKAELTSELLITHRLDPEHLCVHLLNSRLEASQDFGVNERSIYQRVLLEICRAIVRIAPELADFPVNATAATLRGQDEIARLVTRLLEQPTQEAQEFERLYRTAVGTALDRMERFGVPRMDRVTNQQRLSVAYVSLQVTGRKVGERSDLDGNADRQHLASSDLREHLQLKAFGGERTQLSGPIDRVMGTSRRLVIQGQAGSGKSTLLQWAAVHSAAQDFSAGLETWNDTIPFFIRLRELVQRDFPTPEEFPAMVARNHAGKLPKGWVHQQLETGRAVVLIDGVDELSQAKRVEMLEHLERLVEDFPRARYIISSRPAAVKEDHWPEWHDWLKRAEFTQLELQPMSVEQIHCFIDQWHAALAATVPDSEERAELGELPDNLKRLLRQRLPLAKLATSPLLCAMLCALHRERRQNLPSERLKLYQECCELLLSRRDEGRKVALEPDYPVLTESQRLVLVQDFAYWMMLNGYSDVEVGQADDRFGKMLMGLSVPPNTTGIGVRRFLVERSSLLREPVFGRIDFTHRTFQEFLAAQRAVDEGNIGFLLESARNAEWRETIILAAGLARPQERIKLLRGLIQNSRKWKRHRHHQLLLAVACLETCVELDGKVRYEVMREAAPLFPPKNSDEAKMVAAAGDPAVELLRFNPAYTSRQCAACIQALSLIGSDAAMDMIASYCATAEALVISEISAAWSVFDAGTYARRVLKHVSSLTIGPFTSWQHFEHLGHLLNLQIEGGLTDEVLATMPSLLHLSSLSLTGGTITTLGSLLRLPALKKLILDRLEPTALESIARFQGLESLDVYNLPTPDVTPIGALTGLKGLFIYGPNLSEISPLSRLKNLETLVLWGTPCTDIGMLEQLTQLKLLTLSHSPVRDILALSQLKNLTHLDLDRTRVSDITPLTGLERLKYLDLSGTNVTDLTPLAGLEKLEYLDISGTNVTDLTPLAGLTNLRRLRMDGMDSPDRTPLAGLVSLEIIPPIAHQVS